MCKQNGIFFYAVQTAVLHYNRHRKCMKVEWSSARLIREGAKKESVIFCDRNARATLNCRRLHSITSSSHSSLYVMPSERICNCVTAVWSQWSQSYDMSTAWRAHILSGVNLIVSVCFDFTQSPSPTSLVVAQPRWIYVYLYLPCTFFSCTHSRKTAADRLLGFLFSSLFCCCFLFTAQHTDAARRMARTTDRVVYFLLLMLWMTLPIARVCKPRLMGFVYTAARVACNEQSERKSRINVSRAAEKEEGKIQDGCKFVGVVWFMWIFPGFSFFFSRKFNALRVWYQRRQRWGN